MKYIESLREGEKVNEVYLCKFKQAATRPKPEKHTTM